MRNRFPSHYLDAGRLGQPVGVPRNGSRGIRPAQSFLRSLACAWSGLRYALTTQRNLHSQLMLGVTALGLAGILRVPLYEAALLLVLTALVVFAELMNTALELTLDCVVGTSFDPSVKLIKDLAAAAVLVVSAAAGVLTMVILFPHLQRLWPRLSGFQRVWPVMGGLMLLGALAAWVTRRLRSRRRTPRNRFVQWLEAIHGNLSSQHRLDGVLTGILLASAMFLALALSLSR